MFYFIFLFHRRIWGCSRYQMLFSRRVVCNNVTQGLPGHQTGLIRGDEKCSRWTDQRNVIFFVHGYFSRKGGKFFKILYCDKKVDMLLSRFLYLHNLWKRQKHKFFFPNTDTSRPALCGDILQQLSWVYGRNVEIFLIVMIPQQLAVWIIRM